MIPIFKKLVTSNLLFIKSLKTITVGGLQPLSVLQYLQKINELTFLSHTA